MIRVDDLGEIVQRLQNAGHAVEYEGNGEAFPIGRFANWLDPKGRAIRL